MPWQGLMQSSWETLGISLKILAMESEGQQLIPVTGSPMLVWILATGLLTQDRTLGIGLPMLELILLTGLEMLVKILATGSPTPVRTLEDGSLVQEMISLSGLRGLSSILLIGLLGLQRTSVSGPSTLEKTLEKQREMFSTGWVVIVAKFLTKSEIWLNKSKDILLEKQREMFSTGWVVTVAKFLTKSEILLNKSKDILLDSSVTSHIKSSMESTDSILTSKSLVNSLK